MAAAATITVYDGQGAQHILYVQNTYRDPKGRFTAEWREGIANVPLEAQIRLTLTYEQLPSKVRRVEMKVVVPVMESVSGQNSAGYTAAPKVAYENTFTVVGFFHPRSDTYGRKLARMLITNLLNNISTNVGASTNGAAPNAFDELYMPT